MATAIAPQADATAPSEHETAQPAPTPSDASDAPTFQPLPRGLVHKMIPKDTVTAEIRDIKHVARYAAQLAEHHQGAAKKDTQLQLAKLRAEYDDQFEAASALLQEYDDRIKTLRVTTEDAIREGIRTAIHAYDRQQHDNRWWRRAFRALRGTRA
jgi:hypothetical protein